jgi:Domain of unknown function (DUF4440)
VKHHMGSIVTAAALCWLLCPGARYAAARPSAGNEKTGVAATDNTGALAADRAFVAAFTKGDSVAAARLLDTDFTWYETDGSSKSRGQVLASLKAGNGPAPAIADAKAHENTYGELGVVQAASGPVHVLRLWAKRAGGWRAVLYQDVIHSNQPGFASGSGPKDCDNPCKTLPFQGRTAAERAILKGWMQQETGLANHDSKLWAEDVDENFAMIVPFASRPITKADRIAAIDKQKKAGLPTPPAPVVALKMYDFGDGVLEVAEIQPYHGKRQRVIHVWHKRGGRWKLIVTYVTPIESSAAK